MKDLDEVIEGPIVAVQYPSVAPFSVDESTATELSVKYSHLKDLDVDDKKAYKELVSAIKDVSSNRIQINKEEDAVKKPLNAFRKLVLDTGKALRAAFEPVEDALKAEKYRIDTVLADREAAKRKVWQDNLDELKSLYMSIDHNMSMLDLHGLSSTLDKDQVTDTCFGVFLDEANSITDNILIRITETIKYKKEQAEFEAKRIAFEKEQAEAAERERVASEEREAMLKQIEELKKAAEPEQTPWSSGPNESEHEKILDGGQSNTFVIGRPETSYTPLNPSDYPEAEIQEDASTSNGPIEVVHDGAALGMFIAALGRANNMRVITHTKEQNEAVERVKATLVKAIGYLNAFDSE